MVQLVITFVSLAAALATTLLNWASGAQAVVAVDSLALDGPTYFMWTILIIFSAAALLMFAETKIENSSVFAPQAAAVPGTVAEREAIRSRVEHTEVFPLALFALLGMMLFPASNDLITMFVALEILSLPLYLLCGLARRRRLLSQEAALKYFLLGALSSAFFIYGAALLYGYSGSFTLAAIDDALRNSKQGLGLLLAGMAMLGVGLLFKFGAVPFHSWTPDVYAGAPTAVTGFMAACTKIAAVGALMRVFYVGLGADRWDWQPAMAIIAVATMAVGSVLAITQTDVKRMLAYSSIAHAGFMMTAFVGSVTGHHGQQAGRVDQRVIGDVLPRRVRGGDDRSIRPGDHGSRPNRRGDHAQQLGRAGSSPPLAATIFSIFMLSFAGIPLTSGFIGKWAVFAAAWSGGVQWLVVVAVVISVVAAFFYIRVIVLMFFADPRMTATSVVRPGWTTLTAVGVGVVATVAFGVFPGPLLALAQQAGEFIR